MLWFCVVARGFLGLFSCSEEFMGIYRSMQRLCVCDLWSWSTHQNSPSSLRFCNLPRTERSTLSHSRELNTHTSEQSSEQPQHSKYGASISTLVWFSLVTPGSRPLHFTPRVPDAHQLSHVSPVHHLINRSLIFLITKTFPFGITYID